MAAEMSGTGPLEPLSSYPGAFPNCRARESGFRVNTVLCLSKPPIPCQYRKIVGENYVCQHPNRAAIVGQTVIGSNEIVKDKTELRGTSLPAPDGGV